MFKKKLLSLVGMALLLAVTACSSGGKDAQSAKPAQGAGGEGSKQATKNVELRMTWWGSQTRHDLTMKALKLFEEKHPGITVKPEYSGWDGYFDKISTQVAGNNAPDLIQMDYAFLADYAKRGSLLDLTPYTQSKELGIEGHDKSMLTAGSIEGKLYAITLGVNAPGVVYNATVLQELGIEEPKESWTWKDFGDMATKIAKAKGKGYFGSIDISGTTNIFEIATRQTGNPMFKNGQYGGTKEDLVQWFQMWEELRKTGGASTPEVTAATTNALETRPISLGTAAMDFAWSNQLLTFQKVIKNQNHKVKMQVVPHAIGEKKIGEYLKPSQFISGYSKSQHPKETAMVIDFLVNDPDAAKILGSERGVPVNSKIRDQIKPTLSAEEKAIFEFIDLVSAHSSEIDPPYPQGFAEIDKNFKSASEQIAFGQGKTMDISDKFIADSNKILAKTK